MKDKLQALDADLKTEADAYNVIQKDINKNGDARRKFTQQLQENEMVLQEFERLEDASGVFKLIGPVLILQDPIEARSNVGKRLEFIRRELDRLEGQSTSLMEKLGRKQQQIVKLQQAIQEAKGAKDAA